MIHFQFFHGNPFSPGGIGIVAPVGYVFLVDELGDFLVDADGFYLIEPL